MNSILSQIHRFTEQEFNLGEPFTVVLPKKQLEQEQLVNKFRDVLDVEIHKPEKMEVGKSYKITVKQYMTEPATVNFDFQDKWNNGNPMPLCIMQGEVIKETRGMYYMKLKADDITWTGWVIKSSIKEWEEI